MARILVVEDDDILNEMIEDWFTFENHSVVSCASGAEALEQLAILKFDCVVLDFHLGDMTGIDILTKYRRNGGTAPVMMLTGSNHAADRDLAMASGANAFVGKPFQLNQLSDALNGLIKEKQ